MNARLNGTETPSPSIVTQIEIAWLASGDSNETAAVSAGRGITLTTAQDMANFMQATCQGTAPNAAGYALTSTYLVHGITYTPSVRITDSAYGAGSWNRGTAFSATTTTTTTTTTDPQPTKLLLHLNGTNGSTTITDVYGHAITAHGSAQISTSQSVFGGASLSTTRTGEGYLSLPASSDFNFGNGDFTIEGRVRYGAASPNGYTVMLAQWGSAGNNGFGLFLPMLGANTVYWNYSTNGTNTPYKMFTWSPAGNTWYAIALTRSSGVLSFYVDGVRVGSQSDSGASIYASTNPITIGATADLGSIYFADNFFDEIRVTKGLARYTGDSYTVATSEFTN